MSTLQKVLIGAVAVIVISGGAAWAAIESSSSSSSVVSGPVRPVPRMPQAPGLFAPGPGFVRPGRVGGAGLLCRLAHADAVVAFGGGTQEVRLDHGVVDSISADSVTIREADGTVTVPLDAATRVRRDGQEASLSDVRAGDTVFVLRVGGGAAKALRAFDTAAVRCATAAILPGFLQPSSSSA